VGEVGVGVESEEGGVVAEEGGVEVGAMPEVLGATGADWCRASGEPGRRR